MKPIVPLFGVVNGVGAEGEMLRILRSGQIASGPEVDAFRRRFADVIGSDRVVTTSDMSSAMTIALRLASVDRDSEVIASPFACLSTNAPIATSGARILWADMHPETGSLDLADVARLFSARTKAVVVYHVNGYPGPAAELAEMCHNAGVALIEDCDNALGATLGGRPVGNFGNFAIHSFYPNRQINGIEGGALVCRSGEDAERAVRLRRFGIDPGRFRDVQGEIDSNCDVPEIGWAATMSNLHSAYALGQMDGLVERLARTRANAQLLATALGDLEGLEIIRPLPGAIPAYWTFGIRVGGRDKVMNALKEAGIMVSKLHQRCDAYSGFAAAPRALPGTDAFVATSLHIPCGWWLTEADLDRVIEETRDAVLNHGEALP